MRSCLICGASIEGNHHFCPYCGNELPAIQEEEIKTNQQDESVGAPVANPASTSTVISKKTTKSYYILAFVFALVGLWCAVNSVSNLLATIFFFLPSMIVFRCLAKKFYKLHIKEVKRENNFAKAARIINIISLPVGIVFACISVTMALIGIIPIIVTAIETLIATGAIPLEELFESIFSELT